MQGSGASEYTLNRDGDRASRGVPDHYAVLGVEPGAPYVDLRRAFHQAAKQWHPDRYMTASDEVRTHAQRQMRTVLDAYAVLANPARRAVYDAQRLAASQPERATARGHEPDAESYTSWHTGVDDPDVYDRLYANSDPRGVANFLGVLLALVALGLLWSVLHGAAGFGYYLGLACALVIGIAALWCIADPVGLAGAAERLGGGASSARSPRGARSPAGGQAPRSETHSPAAEEGRAEEGRAEEGRAEGMQFERLVDDAVASIPDEFRAYLRNVVVRVKPQPSAAERRQMRLREGETLFGLYEGVMLTNQGVSGAAPEIITIFQWPIERACENDPTRIREQVRRTVLHELAHHFGLDHDAMPNWIK